MNALDLDLNQEIYLSFARALRTLLSTSDVIFK